MSAKHSTALMIGKTFGRLTVLSRFKGKHGHYYLSCKCQCGKQSSPAAQSVSQGKTTSCGCLGRERRTKANTIHGGAKKRQNRAEYTVWQAMRRRCSSPTCPEYRLYGARGIRVCDRWQTSFAAFMEDMGPRPAGRFTLDRIDNNGNYEPGNVRWASYPEQARNKRTNIMVTIGGKTMCLKDWSEESGIHYCTLKLRVRNGWRETDLLAPPKCGNRLKPR